MDAVTATPWHDLKTVIKGSVAAWHASFSNAQAASVSNRADLIDADFDFFRGLRALDMDFCTGVTNAALVNLRGIEFLKMVFCTQLSTSDGTFTHLKGLKELNMFGFGSAIVAGAFHLLRGVRPLHLSFRSSNLLFTAMKEANVEECRRLLSTPELGSSWLYAGVTFHDLPAPASAHDVIATACRELLQVGLELDCAGMVSEAAMGICSECERNVLARDSCIAVGAIHSLLAAIDKFAGNEDDVCYNTFEALSIIARSVAGRAACRSAGVARSIVYALIRCDEYALEIVFCCVASMSLDDEENVSLFVDNGAIELMITVFQKSRLSPVLSYYFSDALLNISCFSLGVKALFDAGAHSILAAVCEKDEGHLSAKRAADALKRMGCDAMES